jgi:hypothetical protein
MSTRAKQSVGVTPHVYLTRKRIERSQQVLILADLLLAQKLRLPRAFPTNVI